MILAGPLGFEPRQSAPKALDLPLVDGPVTPLLHYQTLEPGSPTSPLLARWGGKALDLPLVDGPKTPSPTKSWVPHPFAARHFLHISELQMAAKGGKSDHRDQPL